MLSSTMISLAIEPEENDKQRFVNNILENTPKSQRMNRNSTQNEINEVLKKYVANDIYGALEIINNTSKEKGMLTKQIDKLTYEEFERYLNENNVYIYSYEISEITGGRSSGSNDVQMNSVIISYDASTNTWSVTGGGYWKNTNWEDDCPPASNYGNPTNVGGLDAVGVALMNTSGTLPTLISASGYAHDGNGRTVTFTNPYNSDSSKGVVFQYQDQVYITDDYDYILYLGYGFAAQGIYSSNFAEYSGRARSYHAHTWEDCSINSIGVSTNGFSAAWSNAQYGWEIYNNSDTVF